MIDVLSIKGQDFTVELVEETDELGNVSKVIVATNPTDPEDLYRFSPNSTDKELQDRADDINNPPAEAE